jgi:nitroimidazol reductase NimA-like FMN-containing flavoprotein (pyridoxamine 5'-phosphate oxidase superfamily)
VDLGNEDSTNSGFHKSEREGVRPRSIPHPLGWGGRTQFDFHSATVGRKLEILKKNPKVSFEMDIDWVLVRSGDRCNMRYRSVIGFGDASLIEASEDKRNALDLIMRHYHQEPFAYPQDTLKRTAIIKVEIEEMTGKAYGY